MTETSGFIQQCGPWIPCLPKGETYYTFTPEQLRELLEKTYTDGFILFIKRTTAISIPTSIATTRSKTTVSTNCNSSNIWGKQ